VKMLVMACRRSDNPKRDSNQGGAQYNLNSQSSVPTRNEARGRHDETSAAQEPTDLELETLTTKAVPIDQFALRQPT
jgi:hypothetical protein